jgi:VWFA-related protein
MNAAARIALLLALTATAAAAPVQNPVFSSRVDAVRVDVLVTENGRPVQGLGARDFVVLDNGVPQQVGSVSFEQIPLSVILMLDVSGSLSPERWRGLQTAASSLLRSLTKDEKAALITFKHAIVQHTPLTHDVGGVRSALEAERSSGGTALIDASAAALALSDTDVGRPLVLVFSDSLETTSWLTAEQVLDTAKRSNAVVYGVSLGRQRGDFVRELASGTGGEVLQRDSPAELEAAFLAVLNEFRQRYVISYSPSGVSADGWHRLEVKVPGRRANVRARPGYLRTSGG